jgi:hypothetical protein
MTNTSQYGMYGNRQNEFGYLCVESQIEIIEYCHALANLEATARELTVVTVTAGGFKITQAMIDAEIVATITARPVPFQVGRNPLIIGVNADVGMFA